MKLNKYFKIVLVSILISLAFAGSVMAQDKVTISGRVTDPKGELLPGVQIYEAGNLKNGTTTDIDGNFSIKVRPGKTLEFYFIGFKKYTLKANKTKRGLSIVLEEDLNELDALVVTGMGTQKKVSVVGAITTVDVKSLKVPATNITNMLAGRVPGIMTRLDSGEPGKNISNFWIRGISTFGANQGALVLIDGIEGRLQDIDPDDIESFSILKDASATAVYGVRGANGVVIVTTKKGERGRLNIQARSSFKVSQMVRLPKYLESYDYALLANEARVMSGETELYTPQQLEIIKEGLDPDLFPNTNWTKAMMKPVSFQHNHYLSARGGGDVARYFVSLGFSDEGAAYNQRQNEFKRPTSFKKMTYRSNIDMNITKNTSLYLGIDGYVESLTRPGGIDTGKLWHLVQKLTPLSLPLVYSDGTYPTYGRNNPSPVVLLNQTGYTNNQNNRNMMTLKLIHHFQGYLQGLTMDVQGMLENIAYTNEARRVMPDLYYANGRTAEGVLIKTKTIGKQELSYSNGRDVFNKYYIQSRANYNRTFNSHSVGALLLYYMESAQRASWHDNLGLSAIPERRQNVSGRLTYGYNNTYFIDANFGYTGSAQFKKGERFGFFPSVAIGWVPTGYKFIQKKLPWLNFFKFRASYGLTGNDRIANTRFPYLTIINNHAGTYWGHRGQGIQERQIGADNLKWEVAKKMNFGIDLKMFKDRLSLNVDIFSDIRDNIFQDRVTLPDFVGHVTTPKSNVGRMHSYGSDGNIQFSQALGKGMHFTMRANYTFSQNIIDYFEENKLPYDYLSVTGKPYNILRGYIAEGLFKNQEEINTSASQSSFGRIRPGDIKYRDVNGDGVINGDDKVPLSYWNQLPRIMYGFGADFSWKNFTVSMLWQGAGLVEYYRSGLGNADGWVPFNSGEFGNVLEFVKNPKSRWTPAWYSGDPATENPNAELPRLSYGGNTNNNQLSTFWKRNGSYLRFRELSFKYNMKNDILNKIGMRSIDFEFVINNLFTIDTVKYFDPEQASRNGAVYPIPRTYTVQMYFNF